MAEGAISIMLAGDLVLDEPDGSYWLSGIAPAIRAADLAIGHLEVPHTRASHELEGDVPAPGAPPENIRAIAEAGFSAVSLAGNHMADCGPAGIADTIAELDDAGVAYAGAGGNLTIARRPAFLHSAGRTIALLSYNCVGPEAAWAGPDKPGCAYLRVDTSNGSPVAPTAPLTRLADEAVNILHQDIASVRADADLVIVALHKGIVHTPARLAPYERPVAHAAIDAGADMVVGHHAHIVRGIEFHRGKPIFHGLGNGCVVTRALSPAQDHPARREWAERRKRLFGFEPDPAYTLAPFHPEAVNAFLGRVDWQPGGDLHAAIVPVFVEAPGRPVLANRDQARSIRHYVEKITRMANMPPIMIAEDGRVEAAA